MNKKYCFSLVLLVFGIYTEATLVSADADYKLEITEGTEITWKMSKFETRKIEIMNATMEKGESYLNSIKIANDTEFTYSITDIYDNANHWYVKYKLTKNISDITVMNTYLNVYINPNEVPDSYFCEFGTDSLMIIPVDVENYIDDIFSRNQFFCSNIYPNYISHGGKECGLRFTTNKNITETKYVYNEVGILSSYKVYYNEEIVLEYELEDYSIYKDDYDDQIFIIIIALIFIMLIIIPCSFEALSKVYKNNQNTDQKQESLKILDNSRRNKYRHKTNKTPIQKRYIPPEKSNNNQKKSVYDKFNLLEDELFWKE